MKRVRILADHDVEGRHYKPNQVVDFKQDSVAIGLVKGGIADDAKEAIEAGLVECGGKTIVHTAADQKPGDDGAEK